MIPMGSGWLAAIGMIVAVIVWLIRLEGRVNLLQALSERQESAAVRIESKLDQLMQQRCMPLGTIWGNDDTTEMKERRRKPR